MCFEPINVLARIIRIGPPDPTVRSQLALALEGELLVMGNPPLEACRNAQIGLGLVAGHRLAVFDTMWMQRLAGLAPIPPNLTRLAAPMPPRSGPQRRIFLAIQSGQTYLQTLHSTLWLPNPRHLTLDDIQRADWFLQSPPELPEAPHLLPFAAFDPAEVAAGRSIFKYWMAINAADRPNNWPVVGSPGEAAARVAIFRVLLTYL